MMYICSMFNRKENEEAICTITVAMVTITIPWRIGCSNTVKGVPDVVSVAMVTGGAEVELWAVYALPADAVQRRCTAAITHHTLMFYT